MENEIYGCPIHAEITGFIPGSCPICGKALEPRTKSIKMVADPTLACPSCRVEMVEIDFLELRLDVCPQCAGIWFDDGELSVLAIDAPEEMDALDSRFKPELEVLNLPGKLKNCPRCGQHLDTYRYQYTSPIQLDSCPICHGVFIENQELHAIHDFIEDDDDLGLITDTEDRDNLTENETKHGTKLYTEVSITALLHALPHWRDRKEGMRE